MNSLIRHSSSVAWALLVAATSVSWWLGHDHAFGLRSTGVSAVVLVVAFVKVRLIGLYFMELKHAPIGLRIAFEAYVVATCGTVLGMYLAA